jgi:hypothetical protein
VRNKDLISGRVRSKDKTSVELASQVYQQSVRGRGGPRKLKLAPA